MHTNVCRRMPVEIFEEKVPGSKFRREGAEKSDSHT